MRVVMTAFFGAAVAVALAVWNGPEPPMRSVLRDSPPVIDASGYIVKWADRTPRQIYEMNVQRRAMGKAKGPVPGF